MVILESRLTAPDVRLPPAASPSSSASPPSSSLPPPESQPNESSQNPPQTSSSSRSSPWPPCVVTSKRRPGVGDDMWEHRRRLKCTRPDDVDVFESGRARACREVSRTEHVRITSRLWSWSACHPPQNREPGETRRDAVVPRLRHGEWASGDPAAGADETKSDRWHFAVALCNPFITQIINSQILKTGTIMTSLRLNRRLL